MELSHLFTKNFQCLLNLFIRDCSLVLFQRDRIRSFVISKLNRRLDLNGCRKAKRGVFFYFDPFERWDFYKHRHDSRLADRSIVIIRHQAANDIFFNRFGVALFEKLERSLPGRKPGMRTCRFNSE